MSTLASTLISWAGSLRKAVEAEESAPTEPLLQKSDDGDEGGTTTVEEPDDLYPLHYFDDTTINRSMIMCWSMKFDDVLDPEALRDSLSQVLDMGDWRKLGGRLKVNAWKRLYIHVPKKYSAARPPIRYSHAAFDIKIEDHPLASQLPKATGTPSLHPGPEIFTTLAQGPGSPVSIHDYIKGDEPQIALHVVSFEDATLVSMSWPHTLTDAMGRYALIEAWCHVLAGRTSQVAPLLGAREDLVRPVVKDPEPGEVEEPYALEKYLLTSWQMLLFVLYFFIDVFCTTRVLRTISLTPKAVATLVREGRQDVADVKVGDKPAFVSEGDVLTAWATRLAASELPANSNRTVMLSTVFELRSRLKDVFQQGGAYVQNLVLSATAVVPAQHVLKRPVGSLALHIRQTIAEQTRLPQIQAQARLYRRMYLKKGHGPGFGKPSNFIVVFSNWLKGNFFNVVDFSPAVLPSKTARQSPGAKGKPVYFHCQTLQKAPTSSNIFNILGKDGEGNVWITGYLPLKTWKTVQAELDRLT